MDSVYEVYCKRSLEGFGFGDIDIHYSIGFCQGDFVEVQKARVGLSNPLLIDALFPLEAPTVSSICHLEERMQHRRIRRCLSLLPDESFALVLSRSKYGLSIESDLDTPDPEFCEQDQMKLQQIFGQLDAVVLRQQLEELSDHVNGRLIEFVRNVERKLLSDLHDLRLGYTIPQTLWSRNFNGVEVTLEAIEDPLNDQADMMGHGLGDHNGYFFETLRRVQNQRLEIASLKLTVHNDDSAQEGNAIMAAVLHEPKDRFFGGALSELVSDAVEDYRSLHQ